MQHNLGFGSGMVTMALLAMLAFLFASCVDVARKNNADSICTARITVDYADCVRDYTRGPFS